MARLDAERLDVYKLALDFQLLASSPPLRRQGALRNQLERASISIVLNIAEGAGRRSPQGKCRFYSSRAVLTKLEASTIARGR